MARDTRRWSGSTRVSTTSSLLDVQMPEMDGLAASRAICARWAASKRYLSDYLGQQSSSRTGSAQVGMSACNLHSPLHQMVTRSSSSARTTQSMRRSTKSFPLTSHDSAPVAGTMRLTNVMEVNLAVPVNNVAEFIAYAKVNPGKINFASGGVGTSPHLSGELFKAMTGVNFPVGTPSNVVVKNNALVPAPQPSNPI